MQGDSSLPVEVSAVLDADDANYSLFPDDPIDDPIRAAPSDVVAVELAL